jgi:hypothetical protein
MSLPANPQQSLSPDVALAALAEALEQVGQADERLTQADRQVSGFEESAARQPSAQQTETAVPRPRSSSGALLLWSLIGPLVVAGIGAAAFAWPSPQGQAVRLTIARWVNEGLSSSSVWLERLERVTRPASSDPEVTGAAPRQPSSVPQTMPQQVALAAEPLSPELSQWLGTITRELRQVQQAIEQLKADQAQLVHENAGTAERLKDKQEQMARQSGELAENLKQARSDMQSGSVDIAAQLKASQEQMAGTSQQLKATQEQMAGTSQQLKATQEQMAGISQQLRATQEQMARLRATEQQPRPSIGPSRAKSEPTPASRQVRVRPEHPPHVQQPNQPNQR